MEKEITIAEFADELKTRLNEGKTIECCKPELLRLADIIKSKIGQEKILVEWKEQTSILSLNLDYLLNGAIASITTVF